MIGLFASWLQRPTSLAFIFFFLPGRQLLMSYCYGFKTIAMFYKSDLKGFPLALFFSSQGYNFLYENAQRLPEIPLFTRAERLSGSFSCFTAIVVFASHPTFFFSCGKSSFCVASCLCSHDIKFVQEFPLVVQLSAFNSTALYIFSHVTLKSQASYKTPLLLHKQDTPRSSSCSWSN